MTTCPGTTGHCRCPQHELGLARHAPDPVAYMKALDAIREPIRLSVVTFGPTAEPVPCTSTPTCQCEPCVAERRTLLARGPQGAGNADPFKRAA